MFDKQQKDFHDKRTKSSGWIKKENNISRFVKANSFSVVVDCTCFAPVLAYCGQEWNFYYF